MIILFKIGVRST